ncbi:anti-repressor SinI family protein [Peribacillus sp. NPDC096540]
MLLQTNDRVKELDKEWIELIQMAIKVDIPLEEIRGFLLEGRQ